MSQAEEAQVKAEALKQEVNAFINENLTAEMVQGAAGVWH